MIRWSSTTRLDDYVTVRALRRQIELADGCTLLENGDGFRKKQELALALFKQVAELNDALKEFGVFSDSSRNLKKRVELMRRVRHDVGEVLLCSLRVANALDVDVARSVQERIYPFLQKVEKPWQG